FFFDVCELNIVSGQCDPSSISGDQTMTKSWWPRSTAFAGSGLNVGWWTPMCETWFQRWLSQLDVKTTCLATHQQWRHNLKLERRCPTYVEALEHCAAEILAMLRP
ncbi:hypothetical protein FB451DRAFT_1032535, partial [Mycena latifolia]